jgi:pimeloyl-ACP methyl ester carboxylesterase
MTHDPDVHETAPPSRRWWPLGAAGLMSLTAMFCLVTSWESIRNSHPAYIVALTAAFVGAVGMAWWAWRTPPKSKAIRRRTVVLRIVLVVVTLVPAAVLVWLRPLSPDSVALRALEDRDGVSINSTNLVVRMDPSNPKDVGLVFYPGAKVDPRSYAHILRPIAEAGYTVVIIQLPFNLAVLAPSAANVVVGDDDEIDHWVVGGHSLGGAMAATYATEVRDELVGLLLYAAYPASSMADRTGLDVMSVYGTEDGLATVDDIEASKANLPGTTEFVAIDGGIHAFFGDYGDQAGDGTPTISRQDAQRQIVTATLRQMDRVDTDS